MGPVGLSRDETTLLAMIATLRPALSSQNLSKGLSVEVADEIGISRVTARRYLEYLADATLAERRTLHEGRAGRPEVRYRWR